MAFSRVPLSRVPLCRHSYLSSLLPFSVSHLTLSLQPNRTRLNNLSVSLSTQEPAPSIDSSSANPKQRNRWKPMCLYFTQGKCTMMNDPIHLEKFNHNCSGELKVSSPMVKQTRSQQLDFFLVLDLEGKVEILEFPVLMLDAKTMDVVDMFHRFVRPSAMSEQRINEYIEGKYGKIGVDRGAWPSLFYANANSWYLVLSGICSVWHDTAIPFEEVIQQFEAWMVQRDLLGKELNGRLSRAAFVTCKIGLNEEDNRPILKRFGQMIHEIWVSGNWDLKTKVPQQCEVSGMVLPPYFMEWINLKDIYLNFYKRRATGMITMMKELQIPLVGSHHLGIDDTKNIARVLQHMLADGALPKITARRNPGNPENVEFFFRNRIR
ncbi:unnamed protein product [Camellia sinensis]